MEMTKREKELLERIDQLEQRVKQLEAQPKTEFHYHYHTLPIQPVQPLYPQPLYPYTPYWSSSGCAVGSSADLPRAQ
jgi:hypothetical protein